MDKKKLGELPKIELHCHLDGSLSRRFVTTLLGREVKPSELCASRSCESLNEYLEKFDIPLEILKKQHALKAASYDLMQHAAEENVRYIEMRFDPITVSDVDFSADEAVEAAIEGMKEAEQDYNIKGNIIICAMRHFNLDLNRATLDLTEKYLGRGVCCLDLAGAEAVFPTSDFRELFYEARERKIPFIIHAGETGSVESVYSAVEFGAKRLGHGIAMKGDKVIQDKVFEKKIAVEMCPTSNFQTKAATEEDYPIREFLDRGLLVTINTDNRTVSDTTLTDELELIQRDFNITDEELIQLQKNAIDVSFADEETKERIRKELDMFL
jgi:adenosine deaminase